MYPGTDYAWTLLPRTLSTGLPFDCPRLKYLKLPDSLKANSVIGFNLKSSRLEVQAYCWFGNPFREVIRAVFDCIWKYFKCIWLWHHTRPYYMAHNYDYGYTQSLSLKIIKPQYGETLSSFDLWIRLHLQCYQVPFENLHNSPINFSIRARSPFLLWSMGEIMTGVRIYRW